MPKMMHSRELEKIRTEEGVSRLILRMMYARQEMNGAKGVRRDCLFLPNEFGPMWVSPLTGEPNESLFASPEDINSPEIVWPMSVGYAYENVTSDGQDIVFNYWETVPASILRGKYSFSGRYNVGWYHGRLGIDGNFLSAVMFAAWTGAKWKTAMPIKHDAAFMDGVKDAGMAPIQRYVDTGENDVGIRVAMGQSIALTHRYEWGAQFSFPGSPKVIVPTTPRGILELFNDRDKPESLDRRKALKHWVSEHIRRAKCGSFQHVISHLRGELKFSWRGFDVEIKPAQFDLEKIEANKK